MNDVAIVIPVYKELLVGNEKIAFFNTLKRLERAKFVLVAPDSLNLQWYIDITEFQVIRFKDVFFRNEMSYSELLLTRQFYEAFLEYTYIVIVQTDVWILGDYDKLKLFLQYDYVGAPWENGIIAYSYTMRGIARLPKFISQPQKVFVGNGGLSIRNVESHVKLLNKYIWQSKLWKRVGEDVFFAYYGQRDEDFKIAPLEIAQQFALESSAKERIEEGIIPFGVHAWERFCPDAMKLG